jgi:hypothetical protein
MQVDVRSAVPRTVPATRNLISTSRADKTSSREYTPQKPDRPHTRASVALRTTILVTCSLTLCDCRRWDEDRLYATRLRMLVRVVTRSSLTSLYIYTRRWRQTDNNGRHQSYRYSQPKTDTISDTCYLADNHYNQSVTSHNTGNS